MRRFVTVSHTARPDGGWSLNDLTAGAGRVDVLCRNVQAALCLSHGLRSDAEAYLVFHRERLRPCTVRIAGAEVQMLHPDERSTAARIQQALKGAGTWSFPDWKKVQRGLDVAPFDLEALVARLPGPVVVPHPEGTPVAEADLPADATFVLGDHLPLTPEEERPLAGAARVSVGTPWYHGNHVIAVLQHALDARHGAEGSRRVGEDT